VVRDGLSTWYSSSLDQVRDERTDVVRPAVSDGRVRIGWTSRTQPHSIVVGIPARAVARRRRDQPRPTDRSRGTTASPIFRRESSTSDTGRLLWTVEEVEFLAARHADVRVGVEIGVDGTITEVPLELRANT
jgi:hypothetical protein